MKNKTPADLSSPATADLQGSACLADLAARDRPALTPDTYAVALAEAIRRSDVPLVLQQRRLQALAAVGATAAQASAQELARHVTLLSALFERFSLCAIQSQEAGHTNAAGRYLDAALRAQRAAASAMSALMVLRGEAASAPDNAKGSAAPAASTPDNVSA